MAITKNTGKQDKNVLRNASEPFTLYIKGEPYTLTEESLKEQVEVSLQRTRRWHFPDLKFLSFEGNCLKLLNTDNSTSYEMSIQIEADKLHVSCDCGSEVETLCIHAYWALERLAGYDYRKPFEKYRPKGLFEIAIAHKKHFDIKPGCTGLDISPKEYLGSVYPFFVKMKESNLSAVLNLQGASILTKDKAKDNALAYILIIPPRDEYLTFLMPCTGSLNKAGTEIKSFHHFIQEKEKGLDSLLTGDQKALNKICYEMLKQVENLSEESLTSEEPSQKSSLQTLFHLWVEAIPLLAQQDFVCLYNLHFKNELKSRPAKNRVWKINIRGEVPQLRFELKKNETFYQLQMKATVKGRQVKEVDWDAVFFISEGHDMYKLSSLRDAGMAGWITKFDNCISVFKEHFDEFDKDFLQPLQKFYPVEIMKSGKA